MKRKIIIRTDAKSIKISEEEVGILNKINPIIYKVESLSELKNFKSNSSIFQADAIIVSAAKVKKEVFRKLKELKVISRMGIGVDNIDIAEATEKDVVVAYCPKVAVNEMADQVMAFLLCCNKKLFRWNKLFKQCTLKADAWDDIGEMRKVENRSIRIFGKRLGLIGFGNIARVVSKRAKSFGLEVWAYDPYIKKEIFNDYEVKEVSIDEIFKNCEFVSVHVPFNKETYHMIDKKYFRLMKPEAIFINTSRGEIVKEDDLVVALKERWFECAAIDVFENIKCHGTNLPLVDSPLFGLDNIILTPHCSASSKESRLGLNRLGAENAVSVLEGYWPEDYANKEVVPKIKLKKFRKSD